MRKLFFSLTLLCIALSSVEAQNLEKILKDHYKASGQEKMAKVKTVIMKGKNTLVTAGIESEFTLYLVRPNQLRVQSEINGSQVVYTFNGSTGWMYAPSMGISTPQELGTEELNSLLQQANFESQLWNYEEKGCTVEWIGSSDDGLSHKLKMTQKDESEFTFLIDKKSHLMTGVIMEQVMGGAKALVETQMKDYKAVKGIQTPRYTSTKMDGELMTTVEVSSVEFNKDIDPSLFEKPSEE